MTTIATAIPVDILSKYERMRNNQRKANKKYREAHPEKFREYSNKYYKANTEKQKEMMKKNYEKRKLSKNKEEFPENSPNI